MRHLAAISVLLAAACGPSKTKPGVNSQGGEPHIVKGQTGEKNGGQAADEDAASRPLVVVAHQSDELRVLNTAGTVVARLPVTEVQNAVAVSNDGRLLAAGRGFAPSKNGWTEDGSVWLWNVDSRFAKGAEVKADFTLEGHQREMIVALAFTDDGSKLMSAGDRGRLILWNLETREPLKRWKIPYTVTASMSGDGSWFVTHHLDGVRLWSIKKTAGTKLKLPASCMDSAFAPGGTRFAVVCKNVVYEFEPPATKPVRELTIDLAYGRGVAYTGDMLASLYLENQAILWQRDSGDKAMIIEAGDSKADEAFRLAFDPTGSVLALAFCNELRGFDVAKREALFSFSLPVGQRCRPALAFIPR